MQQSPGCIRGRVTASSAAANFATSWKIMLRVAFISNGSRGHYGMPHRNGTIKHASTTARDKFPASQGDHLFEHTCCQWCPNPRVKDRQPLPFNSEFIDRVRPYLAPQMSDHPGIVLLRQSANHILEKAHNGMFRYIERLKNTSRFEYCFCRTIELQDGKVMLHLLCRPLFITLAAPKNPAVRCYLSP